MTVPAQPSASGKPARPILIWGGGAIGGVLAAYWARAAVPVLMVDIVAAHVHACRTEGLAIDGPVEQFRQVVPAVTPDELQGEFEVIVLAVKAHATDTALSHLLGALALDTCRARKSTQVSFALLRTSLKLKLSMQYVFAKSSR